MEGQVLLSHLFKFGVMGLIDSRDSFYHPSGPSGSVLPFAKVAYG